MVSRPEITFDNNFLLEITKTDGSKKYYSSIERYNNNLKNSEVLSSITYTRSDIDQNNDLVSDILKLSFFIEEENIASANLNLFLSYKFTDSIFVNFTDVVSFDDRLQSGTKSKIFGYFEIEQLQSYNNM